MSMFTEVEMTFSCSEWLEAGVLDVYTVKRKEEALFRTKNMCLP